MPQQTDLLERARAGDHDAFGELTSAHRRELQVHCYRMLGSLHDAEDALQETLLAAWHALPGFEERASLRTWLYRIATNRCLDALRAARRRPPQAWDVPGVALLEPSSLDEVVWLEPFPDAHLPGAADIPLGPEARYDQSESVSLAFVTALQLLPPRQLAVVVLRDVLGFSARAVAEMLDATVESVTSALKRARASLDQRLAAGGAHTAVPTTAEQALVERFAEAWKAADVDAVVSLLTDDAFVTMPPMPYRYDGRALVGRFFAGLFDGGRRFELVPTKANGQPAFGVYLATPSGPRPGVGLYVLAITTDGISAAVRFEPSVLASFGLPDTLPPGDQPL